MGVRPDLDRASPNEQIFGSSTESATSAPASKRCFELLVTAQFRLHRR